MSAWTMIFQQRNLFRDWTIKELTHNLDWFNGWYNLWQYSQDIWGMCCEILRDSVLKLDIALVVTWQAWKSSNKYITIINIIISWEDCFLLPSMLYINTFIFFDPPLKVTTTQEGTVSWSGQVNVLQSISFFWTELDGCGHQNWRTKSN